MATRLSDLGWNAMLNAWETYVGTSPILRIYTGGEPSTLEAAPTGTLLASGTAPPDWLAAAASGSIAKLGTWNLTGSAAGTAGYYRMRNSLDTLTVGQGLVGSQVVLSTSALSAVNSNVLNFGVATAGAGIFAGMRVTGAGVPVDTYVVATSGNTAITSRTLVAGVASSASITFRYDLTVDNPVIAPSQAIEVVSWSLTRVA